MGDKERRREGVMVPEPWTQGAEWAMKLLSESRLAVPGQLLTRPALTYAYSAMVSGDADNLLYPPEHYKIKGGWQEGAAGRVGRQRSDVTTGAESEVTKRSGATRRSVRRRG